MIIPSFEIMKPNSLPFVTAKMDFLGLREMMNFLHLSNTFFKSKQMILSFFRVNGNIIKLHNNKIVDQTPEIYVHSSLECGSYIY